MIPLQIVIFQQRRCHNTIIPGSCAYYSPMLEDTYYSQIIPGIICQSLVLRYTIFLIVWICKSAACMVCIILLLYHEINCMLFPCMQFSFNVAEQIAMEKWLYLIVMSAQCSRSNIIMHHIVAWCNTERINWWPVVIVKFPYMQLQSTTAWWSCCIIPHPMTMACCVCPRHTLLWQKATRSSCTHGMTVASKYCCH